MLDREPFLQAIFATPEDNLPRLVFADWLEEQGDVEWAALIRAQCDEVRVEGYDRGFRIPKLIEVTADELADFESLRLRAVTENPEWFGANRLKVRGLIQESKHLLDFLESPITQNVVELDLSGEEVEDELLKINGPEDEIEGLPRDLGVFGLTRDFTLRPTASSSVVRDLVVSPVARRLLELDLTNNELDNDLARVLSRRTQLIRIRKLNILQGNRFRGRIWQLLVERFGEDVAQ